jgi:hypothetical protein
MENYQYNSTGETESKSEFENNYYNNLIRENPENIRYIQDNEQIERILISDGELVKYLDDDIARGFYTTVLWHNGIYIKYLQDKYLTDNHWIMAIHSNPKSFQFLKNKHTRPNICKYAIAYCGTLIRYLLSDPTNLFTTDQLDFYMELAIKSNPKSIYYMKKTKKLCELAFSIDKTSIIYMLNMVKTPYEPIYKNELNLCKLKGCGHIFKQNKINHQIYNKEFYCKTCTCLFQVEFIDNQVNLDTKFDDSYEI